MTILIRQSGPLLGELDITSSQRSPHVASTDCRERALCVPLWGVPPPHHHPGGSTDPVSGLRLLLLLLPGCRVPSGGYSWRGEQTLRRTWRGDSRLPPLADLSPPPRIHLHGHSTKLLPPPTPNSSASLSHGHPSLLRTLRLSSLSLWPQRSPDSRSSPPPPPSPSFSRRLCSAFSRLNSPDSPLRSPRHSRCLSDSLSLFRGCALSLHAPLVLSLPAFPIYPLSSPSVHSPPPLLTTLASLSLLQVLPPPPPPLTPRSTRSLSQGCRSLSLSLRSQILCSLYLCVLSLRSLSALSPSLSLCALYALFSLRYRRRLPRERSCAPAP
ncbi:uncharacterized protein LOC133352894 isoform X1 [Lethenteron reissneri]|uniref:uncharacterized protein LOC133352894 isoform X1 n=1 Tax=Lethenteron reissneri TaxID=7753 RepID=UPI002AB6C3DF|nr:uncharacterized protein LOC133352894 isoform X1 [Lethenteron reissneri]XP_061424873.1 uncharacterized protein LOC133352894 isoform X1 [Lethenteron reissneri]